MSGPNPQDNPGIDYTSLDAVLKLLENQQAWFKERKRAEDIHLYLLKLQSWKDNNEQKIANKLTLDPPPIPPVGYIPPIPPPILPLPPPNFTPIVEPINQWGQYSCPGDINPIGTEINWNGIHLIKVGYLTPWGTSQWWREKK